MRRQGNNQPRGPRGLDTGVHFSQVLMSARSQDSSACLPWTQNDCRKSASGNFPSHSARTQSRGRSKEGAGKASFSPGPEWRKVNKAWCPNAQSPQREFPAAESGHQNHGNGNNELGADSEIYRLWPLLLHILEGKKKKC